MSDGPVYRLVVAAYRVLPRRLTAQIVRLVKPTFPIGVVAVVFDEAGRILILDHTYHQPNWRLPGGLLERGESPETTCVREVSEEACCRVKPIAVVGAWQEAHSFDVAVLAELIDEWPFVPSAEIRARSWIDRHSLSCLTATQRRAVEHAWTFLGRSNGSAE